MSLILNSFCNIEVVKVLKPFLTFLKSYDANQVPNMLVIMLDLRFKHLPVVKNNVGQGNVIHFAYEYDAKVVIPLHMIYFHQLNLLSRDAMLMQC
jgi:hypothetical protein